MTTRRKTANIIKEGLFQRSLSPLAVFLTQPLDSRLILTIIVGDNTRLMGGELWCVRASRYYHARNGYINRELGALTIKCR